MTTIAGIETSKPKDLPEFNTYLIDGAAGSGKTSLLGSVGKGNKVLIIDTEGGTISFNSPAYEEVKDATELENIDVISLGHSDGRNLAQMVHVIESVFDHIIRTKNSDGYTLVAVDSLTEFQKLFISRHGASDIRQSYGAWADTLYSIVHKAIAAPVDVVFVSRPKLSQDEVSGKDVARSSVSPAAWSIVSGLFDATGLLSVKTRMSGASVRTLNFTHNQLYQAKQRMGLAEHENPSMREILDIVKQNRSKDGVKETKTAKKPTTLPKFSKGG